jgi:hypothetical protein
MLLELAIGDAYGAGFEDVDAEMIRQQNDLSGYVKHPRHHIQPGCYTDDTQMSLDRHSQVPRMDERAGCGDCSAQMQGHEGCVEDLHSIFG